MKPWQVVAVMIIVGCAVGSLVLLVGAATYHPRLEDDFDAHFICSIDGHAYVAAADDGVSAQKTLTRAQEYDSQCAGR
jgi:hypothetical protein